jgi:hypothetical protein
LAAQNFDDGIALGIRPSRATGTTTPQDAQAAIDGTRATVTRVKGVARAVNGGTVLVIGAGLSDTGIGAVVGVPLAAWGVDQLNTGVKEIRTGQPQTSFGGTVIQSRVGGGPVGQVATFAYDTVPAIVAPVAAARIQTAAAPMLGGTAGACSPGARVTISGIPATELAGRLSPAEMAALQRQYGTEFAQIYLTGPGRNGGGGTYYLIQGTRGNVSVPLGDNVRWINHTHPETLNGVILPRSASLQDKDVLIQLQAAGSPQRTSQIVPEVGEPFSFQRW